MFVAGIGVGLGFPATISPSQAEPGQDWCSTIAEGDTRTLIENQVCAGIFTCDGWLELEDSWLIMDGGE